MTYKCLTRPDTEYCKEGDADYYYSYTYNSWVGNKGNSNTLINWSFIPNYLNIGSYTGDAFCYPTYWDTMVNEQRFDSFEVDYKTLKYKVGGIQQGYLFNNYDGHSNATSNDNVGMIVYTRKHFYVGNISTVSITNDGYSGLQGGYLVLQVYKELDNENEIPTTYYSENKLEKQDVISNKCYNFYFNNCTLTDYAKVHISLVNDKTIIPPYKPSLDPSILNTLRIHSITRNNTNDELEINGLNDECGVYWHNNTESLQNRLASISINKVVLDDIQFEQLKETIEINNQEISIIKSNLGEQNHKDFEFIETESISFGVSHRNDSNANTHGFILKSPVTASFNTITLRTGSSTISNIWAIIHEEQEDGSKLEIAMSKSAFDLSSTFTEFVIPFTLFKLTQDKVYYIEFVTKNEETSDFNQARPKVNLSFINDSESLGIISSLNRGLWSPYYASQYSVCAKFTLSNKEISDTISYPLVLTAMNNNELASNIILFKPSVYCTTDIKHSSEINHNTMTIILEKDVTSKLGNHHIGIKTMYLNTDTNKIKEIVSHYQFIIS